MELWESLQRWPHTLTPGQRAMVYVALLAGAGYWLYGRDGTMQALLPFPQADLSKRFEVVK